MNSFTAWIAIMRLFPLKQNVWVGIQSRQYNGSWITGDLLHLDISRKAFQTHVR